MPQANPPGTPGKKTQNRKEQPKKANKKPLQEPSAAIGPTDRGGGQGDIGPKEGITGMLGLQHVPGVLEGDWETEQTTP